MTKDDHASAVGGNDDLLIRLESKAARIYAWIEQHDGSDIAKSERYRIEADLYIEAVQRIRQLEAAIKR